MIIRIQKPRKECTQAEQLAAMIDVRRALEEGADYVHVQFNGSLLSFSQQDLPTIRQKILYSM